VARRYPHRFAVMGRIALRDPKSVRLLPGWRRQPGMLGIRVPFIGPAANWLADGSADWLWPAAERARVPLMVLAPDQSAGFIPIAQRHPDLVLIIDHMGLIADNVAAGKLADAVDQTLSLAKFPNVSVKLSGVTNNSSQDYPYPEFTPHIKRLFEAYGRERCYWGSDLTNNLGKASYRQRVTHFTEQLPFLTETDKDWVMGRSILRRLGWG
jgi:predicted TIM-barrel fold metal-dependent hydrolase